VNSDLFAQLLPLRRSLTGEGVRASLRAVAQYVPLAVVEVPTGTPILDWHVPQEWSLHDAYIADRSGRRLVDLQRSALHVVGYSEPVRQVMTFEQLRPHLHTMPDRPDWIPYRTSYWNRTWGFCVPHAVLPALEAAGPLEVVIDSELRDGSLSYGELVIPGSDPLAGELLLSTHICHPELANDNVSGMVALTDIGLSLLRSAQGLRHTVRLLYLPGTVGALAWLSAHPDAAQQVRGGLVMTGLGDSSPLTYKASRRGSTRMDRLAKRVLNARDPSTRLLPWDPYGYDERQFCSPGFDLAVGRLTRGVHGRYPEYHTSGDNAAFVSAPQIEAAIQAVLDLLQRFDAEPVLHHRQPLGEPQLGRRGLYSSVGGAVDSRSIETSYLWVLSLADGQHGLADVVEQAGLPSEVVQAAYERLFAAGLVEARKPS
jgi:aminopeptidase-like protein